MIELRGITWDHPRGYAPLVATANGYTTIHPEISVRWESRTLQEFADYPLGLLAERYDLMVIDHPHIGVASAKRALIPMDHYLSEAQLAEQAANSVGKSNVSYNYQGHQWALAIDAAAHVSAYRADLLERSGETVPGTWDEVLLLAGRLRRAGRGAIAVPLIPVDSLMCFYSLCANTGEDPCQDEARVVSRPVGRYALELLQALLAQAHPESLRWNPPSTLDRMATTDEVVYCPLLFGYSNYARPGFRQRLVHFTSIPSAGGGPRGAILGGTGLAISSHCANPEAACAYAAYVASRDVQRGDYFDAGGQPGHRAAWTDARVNAASSDFFGGTLSTLDQAYLRPRYHGYMGLQERGGELLHAFLRDGNGVDATLDELDSLYRRSRADAL
jgi:multiple sugar transport system substrate-binding protein